MSLSFHPAFCRPSSWFAAVLALVTTATSAQNPATSPASAPAAVSLTDEQKAALDVLDGVIARFESLLDRDDDARHKAATKIMLDEFKQRRAAIRQNFDQGRYDELRIDINLEYQRLANWMRPPITPGPQKTPTTRTTTRGN